MDIIYAVKRTLCQKVISLIIILSFISGEVAFTDEIFANQTLSAQTSFTEDGFQEAVGASFVNRLISDVLMRYGTKITDKELISFISKRIKRHRKYEHFKFEQLTKKGEDFYLPINSKEEIKYSLKKNKVEITLEKREKLSGASQGAALLLVEQHGKWQQGVMTDPQHKVINKVWRENWDTFSREYATSTENPIYRDIVNKLMNDKRLIKEDLRGLDVNVHTPPYKYFSQKLYDSLDDFKEVFPNRFFFVTHVGTGRMEAEGPASFNFLIPKEIFSYLAELKEEADWLYKEWLEHETEHIIDKALSDIGKEKREEEVTGEFSVEQFIDDCIAFGDFLHMANGNGTDEGSEKKTVPVHHDDTLDEIASIKEKLPWYFWNSGKYKERAVKRVIIEDIASVLDKKVEELTVADFKDPIPGYNITNFLSILEWSKKVFRARTYELALFDLLDYVSLIVPVRSGVHDFSPFKKGEKQRTIENHVVRFFAGLSTNNIFDRLHIKQAGKIKKDGTINFPRIGNIKVCYPGRHVGKYADLEIIPTEQGEIVTFYVKTKSGTTITQYYRDENSGLLKMNKVNSNKDDRNLLAKFNIVSFLRGVELNLREGEEVIYDCEGKLQSRGIIMMGGEKFKVCKEDLFPEGAPVRLKLRKDDDCGVILECFVKKDGKYVRTTYHFYERTGVKEKKILFTEENESVGISSLEKLSVFNYMMGEDITTEFEILTEKKIQNGKLVFKHAGREIYVRVAKAGEHEGENARLRLVKDQNHGMLLEVAPGIVKKDPKGKLSFTCTATKKELTQDKNGVTNRYYHNEEGQVKSMRIGANHGRLISLEEMDFIAFFQNKKVIPRRKNQRITTVSKINPDGNVSLPLVKDIGVACRDERFRSEYLHAELEFVANPEDKNDLLVACYVEGEDTPSDHYFKDFLTKQVTHFSSNKIASHKGSRSPIRSIPEYNMHCYLKGKTFKSIPKENPVIKVQCKINRGRLRFFAINRLGIKFASKYDGQVPKLRFYKDHKYGVVLLCELKDKKGRDYEAGIIRYNSEKQDPEFIPFSRQQRAYSDITPEISARDKIKARQRAQGFIDSLIDCSYQVWTEAAASGEKEDIIFGIDTSWMPKDQGLRYGLQELINELIRVNNTRPGYRNIKVVRSKGEHLAQDIIKEIEGKANVIILGDGREKVRASIKKLESNEQIKRFFYAGIDPKCLYEEYEEHFAEEKAVESKLVEMLTMALAIVFRDKELFSYFDFLDMLGKKYPDIAILPGLDPNSNYLTFIPGAKAMEINTIRENNLAQTELISA